MAIYFFEEDIKARLEQKRLVKTWIKESIQKEKKNLGTLNYIFCSDDYLYQMNVEYLQHNTLTDIITFDQSEIQDLIEGDIFISVERVKENALKFGVDYIDELHRVMIHGALHLIGYKDKNKEQQSKMREKENYYLKRRMFYAK